MIKKMVANEGIINRIESWCKEEEIKVEHIELDNGFNFKMRLKLSEDLKIILKKDSKKSYLSISCHFRESKKIGRTKFRYFIVEVQEAIYETTLGLAYDIGDRIYSINDRIYLDSLTQGNFIKSILLIKHVLWKIFRIKKEIFKEITNAIPERQFSMYI